MCDCNCAEHLKAIQESHAASQRNQATLAFSLMQISEALIALCDREANSLRIEESARKLRAGLPKLRAIVDNTVPARPDEEDTKPDHPRIKRERDERDTDPAPPLPPEEA